MENIFSFASRFEIIYIVSDFRRRCTLLHIQFDGLVQERRNSIANALELRLSCTNPSSWWGILISTEPYFMRTAEFGREIWDLCEQGEVGLQLFSVNQHPGETITLTWSTKETCHVVLISGTTTVKPYHKFNLSGGLAALDEIYLPVLNF